MSKFNQLTIEMKEYIGERGMEKMRRETSRTWQEVTDDFNNKWKDEQVIPINRSTFQSWTKKLNPNWREDDDTKTWVTPERVEYVRERLDVPNKELAEETGLTEYVVHVIKEAKRHNFYKGAKYGNRGGPRVSKFEKLTDKMESWLRSKAIDKQDTWQDITNQFNRKYSRKEFVPIAMPTIARWGKEMSEEA